jgi:phage tail-like protein
MNELIQTFNFRVYLNSSAREAQIWAPPPDLGFAGAARRPTAPRPRPAGEGGEGGFQECTGLGLDVDVKDHVEGGRNDGVARHLGHAKLQPIVLKRGMFVATDGGYASLWLWRWLQDVIAGMVPVPRYDGTIAVRDAADARVVARWTFARGLPLKVAGPTLNAKTGDIAIEELQIAHEGLRLEDRP